MPAAASSRIQDTPNLEEEALRELARVDFCDFTTYTKPDYVLGEFNKRLTADLQRFSERCAVGERPRLILSAPPRHGKSELASVRLPAYFLGRWPKLRVGAITYSEDLSGDMSREVERVMADEPYAKVFPGVEFPQKGKPNPRNKINSVGKRELVHHDGSYRATGVRGGIVGMGFHMAIIDDPVKDAVQANSETTRKAIQEWYRGVLRNRMEPGGGIMILMTRWHQDDLAGWLMDLAKKGEGEQFEVHNYQAIAEWDEEFRKEGEALFPERYDLEELEAIKVGSGSYAWTALYQGSPSVKGGTIFKGDWWQYWKEEAPPRIQYRIITADTAQKTKERNDYSVFQCWGAGHDGRAYLLDQIRGKWESPELLVKAVAFWVKHTQYELGDPVTREMLIEDKSSGTGLIQQLQRGIQHGGKTVRIPVRGIPRHIDKVVRARDGAPHIENKSVVLPESAPWLSDFLQEFQAFSADNSHSFDDQVDPALDAIEEILGGTGDIYKGAV